MNDSFKLSTNSYTYKFLIFCSSWFFTSWMLPSYRIDPRLKCLDSVCTLVTKLFCLVIYLLLSGLTLYYTIDFLFFNLSSDILKGSYSSNPFKYMGILLPFMFLACILAVMVVIVVWFVIGFIEYCIEAVGERLPDIKGFKLFKQYSTDKSNGLCRSIEIIDLKDEKE